MNPFTDHPRSVGETYAGHAAFACAYGAKMIAGGLAAVVHGLLPFAFQSTGSRITRELHDTLQRSAMRAPRGTEAR